jgi:hypothetical protein
MGNLKANQEDIKMLKLPYKTTPKEFEKVAVGNTEVGELEIPKLGDLSPNERTFIKQASKDLPDLRKLAVKLAKDIAAKSGKKLLEVYNALTTGDAEALSEYLEEFVSFQDAMEDNAQRRELIMATAIIKMRLEGDWGIENTGNAEEIHPKLVNLVAQFARNEESGWVQSTTETTEDDLGKSLMENPMNPTGEKSSGESDDTGATIKDSKKETSDSNQPG